MWLCVCAYANTNFKIVFGRVYLHRSVCVKHVYGGYRIAITMTT